MSHQFAFLKLLTFTLLIPLASFSQWQITAQLPGGPMYPGWPIPVDAYATGFCFPSMDTGYYYYNYSTNSHIVLSSGNLLITTNGGSTWNICYTYDQYVWANLAKVSFCDSRYAYLCASNPVGAIYTIMKTTDTHCNWDFCIPVFSKPEDLFTVSKNKAFYLFSDGKLVKMLSDTDTLVTIIPGYSFTEARLKFFNNNTGYLLGDYLTLSDNKHRLLKTTDDGNSWDTVFHSNIGLNDMSFPCVSTGYISGDSGLVFKTDDNGINWTTLQTPCSDKLIALSFHDSLTGIVISSDTILRTNDGGLSWDIQQPPELTELRHIEMVNDTIAYILGYTDSKNVLVKTTSGGYIKIDDPPGVKDIPAIFPNPADQLCHLSFPASWQDDHEITISISNIAGKVCKEWQVYQYQEVIELPVAGLSLGMYTIRLTSDRARVTLKLLII